MNDVWQRAQYTILICRWLQRELVKEWNRTFKEIIDLIAYAAQHSEEEGWRGWLIDTDESLEDCTEPKQT